MKTDDIHRWNMIQLAIEDNEIFSANNHEMKQEAWKISTYQTLNHFKETYPDDEFHFIMGADLLLDIGAGKWNNADLLIQEYKFIVMARDGINMLTAISKSPILRNNDDGSTFHLIDKGVAMEISSTYIREEFARGGEPRYLLPESCYHYIKSNGLYE